MMRRCIGVKRSLTGNKVYANVFKLQSYHKVYETADVERLLVNKFYRVHDIELREMKGNVHLVVNYRAPDNPKKYVEAVNTLAKHINRWECSMLFHSKIQNVQFFPNYFIDPSTCCLINIPVVIDLEIPSEEISL